MPAVCLDASVVVLWLLEQELTPRADAKLAQWRASDTELIAPQLLTAEVPSVLRQAVHRQRISAEEGDEAFDSFLEMGIRIRQPARLVQRAWQRGKELDAPRLYDMCYVALAETEQCELWTADRRLVNLVGRRAPLVRWVGE